MNKNNIRTFALWARRKLIYDIKNQLEILGIFKDSILKEYNYKIPKSYRDELAKEVMKRGFEEVVEEAAYVWFIRIIAFRYMEINHFIMDTSKCFFDSEESFKISHIEFISEISTELNLNNDEKLNLKKNFSNDLENLYKTILILRCRKFANILPDIFYNKNRYMEILIPDKIFDEESILKRLITDIDERDFKRGVEIIGWLYQYYMSDKKDDVFNGLKENIKITKENIPAATQLFTPKWIVQYMVENSLVRVVKSHGINRINISELKEKCSYYLDDYKEESEILDDTKSIRHRTEVGNIENIKIIDPCMGSGHILVYAFDFLYEIYKKAGYEGKKIPRLILENNLYGLDIDYRAVQLGTFALFMKCREYNDDFFTEVEYEYVNINMCTIEESNDISKEEVNYFVNAYIESKNYSDEVKNEKFRKDIEYLVEIFKDAKEYGSILDVKNLNFVTLKESINTMKNKIIPSFQLSKHILFEKILKLINQGEILSGKYDAVITNPPYMGIRGLNDKLSSYLCENYPVSKYDMFSVYMEVCKKLAKENSFYSMITPHSWMFLSSFTALREKLIKEGNFINMIHLGARAFEENVGTIVQNVAFIFRNGNVSSYKTKIIDLTKEENSREKEKKLISIKKDKTSSNVYIGDLKILMETQTKSIAYWISDNVIKLFSELPPLSSITKPRQGIATSDNKRFLKNWFEVERDKIKFDALSKEDAMISEKKWFPYNKGGDYRKWYGNNEYVINWEKDGKEVKEYASKLYKSYSRTIKNEDFFFRKCLTYTFISEDMGVRYCPNGFIFDVAGSSVFFEDNEKINVILGFLCSKVAKMFLDTMNPTYNIQVGDLKNIPIKEEMYTCIDIKEKIDNLVRENIEISKREWDSFEISWDFHSHPLAKRGMKLSEAFKIWEEKMKIDFNKIKRNEEMLNKIFIELYGLQDELSESMNDEDITFRKADVKREVKSLISYIIGCIFGRYDAEGVNNYRIKSGEVEEQGTKSKWFAKNNIIPITEDEYFEDDIVYIFVEFIREFYGEENLEENLEFIASSLKKKEGETSRQVIRRYFIKEFYKDHVKTYEKKPIYWMFDSGKNDGFKALIYMHRYEPDMISKIRENYLKLLIKKYEEEAERLSLMINSEVINKKHRSFAKKKTYRIYNQIEELKKYNNIAAYVDGKKIIINLDDGIRHNYEKFQGINMVDSKGQEVKMNLLCKI
ncbi:MAG: BREX-1 system adenine-specific DNA-methyltransferase PglX [Clostridium cadaveris]|uniref:BREX-1 system adenine-specific DNA-methyltransferase PglX n=1 Tax=Clostridium cadaveris TaxID=1529 RepID=UPI002A8DD1C9|nr:BREX-1 system adenine-specific DNA-methyltransferase PglX [Clostridium cadaveris]